MVFDELGKVWQHIQALGLKNLMFAPETGERLAISYVALRDSWTQSDLLLI